MSKTRRTKKPPAEPSEDVVQPPASPWRFQFSLRTMLFATALCCIMAAVWGGLLRAMQNPDAIDFKGLVFFTVLAVGAPIFLMTVLSLIEPLRRLVARFRRRKDEP